MSERTTRTLTCDQCGKAHDRSAALDATGRSSWLTLGTQRLSAAEPSDFTMTGTVSLGSWPQPQRRDPDLCSWACAAAYAKERADAELAAEAKAATA